VTGRGFPDHIFGCPGGCCTRSVASWEVFRNILTVERGESAIVPDRMPIRFEVSVVLKN